MASEDSGFFSQARTDEALRNEKKKFGIPFSGPTLVSVGYEKRMIKAVLQKF